MSKKVANSFWEEWKQIVKGDSESSYEHWCWSNVLVACRGPASIPNVDNYKNYNLTDLLTCQFCSQIMDAPYTLQCGCTSCKSCSRLDQDTVKNKDQSCVSCSRKSYTNPKTLKVNVVLNSCIKKCFSNLSKALNLSKIGYKAFLNNDFDIAVSNIEEAVKLYPGYYSLWKDRASIFYNLGRNEEALESIERAFRSIPPLHEVYFEKGKILHKMERKSEAAVALLCSISANKDDPQSMELLNKVMIEIAKEGINDEKSKSDVAMETEEFDEVTSFDETGSSCNDDHCSPLECILEKYDEEVKTVKSEKDIRLQMQNLLTAEQHEQLASDLECNLCSRLFFEPVTTPCGHVFCRECLRRWLDHNCNCPMCRFSLFEFVAVFKLEISKLVERFVETFFPVEVEKRASTRSQEMEDLARIATDTDDFIPIFVCCNALPSRPLQLQIFEPRYRLMLRQCLESGSRQFGMCTYHPDTGFADYGTMVEIRNAYFVPDGRACVECMGGRRFQVLSRGVRDGYNIAKVDWIKDAEVSGDQLEHIISLNNDVYSEMKNYVINFFRQRNKDISGLLQFPELGCEKVTSRDGPEWIWWLIDCLFDATPFQLTIISTRSLEERLNLIRKHFELEQM